MLLDFWHGSGGDVALTCAGKEFTTAHTTNKPIFANRQRTRREASSATGKGFWPASEVDMAVGLPGELGAATLPTQIPCTTQS